MELLGGQRGTAEALRAAVVDPEDYLFARVSQRADTQSLTLTLTLTPTQTMVGMTAPSDDGHESLCLSEMALVLRMFSQQL